MSFKYIPYSIVVTHAENGYIIREVDPQGNPFTVIEELNTEHGKAEAAEKLLREINDRMGCPGSRHDKKRVYIISRPGDKHEDFTNMDAEVIWGDPKDPDITLHEIGEEDD